MMARVIALVLVASAPGACAATGRWVGADTSPRDFNAVLKQNPLADGENIKVARILRNDHVEHLLVQVRDREPLHYHADSDLTVTMLRGKGVILIGANETPIRAGDVVHVPRGVVHAYVNHGPEPGVAFVVLAPPPGPADRVLTEPGDRLPAQ